LRCALCTLDSEFHTSFKKSAHLQAILCHTSHDLADRSGGRA
jgi:hypothetical protein